MRNVSSLYLVAFMVLSPHLAAAAAPSARAGGESRVSYSQLGGDIPVEGPLGPLGALISITGTRTPDEEKVSYRQRNMTKLLFTVTKVNGRKLAQPIEIDLRPFSFLPVTVPAGKVVTLRGYQTGGFGGIPSDAYARMMKLGGAVADDGWRFHVHFVPLERIDEKK